MKLRPSFFAKILLGLIALLFVLSVTSCDIYKQSQKSKSDTAFSQSEETKSFRKGDTVHFEIPKYNVKLKDTTIYRTNYQGTTIKTIYDQNGNVSSIDCYASRIEELTKKNLEYQNALKEKASEKKEELNTTWILYLIIGIVIIFMFALFLMFKFFDKKTSAITDILQKVS
jgi:CHASE3 domain sensor protein